jgi:hypothetical protein
MDAESAAKWMLSTLEKDGCIYQGDIVDYLVKSDSENLLRENADGNKVLNRNILAAFRRLTEVHVV